MYGLHTKLLPLCYIVYWYYDRKNIYMKNLDRKDISAYLEDKLKYYFIFISIISVCLILYHRLGCLLGDDIKLSQFSLGRFYQSSGIVIF